MFKKATLIAFAVAAASSTVFAAPAAGKNPQDQALLQAALELENLESAFYSTGLSKLSPQDFENAGYPSWVRDRLEQIREHEVEHVEFLKYLNDNPPAPCEYNFGDAFDSPQAFVKMSTLVETIGASAYLGGLRFIQDKDILTAAGSILAVESRQASWLSSSVQKDQPWDGPFETPLSMSAVLSLVEPYEKNCPSTDLSVPVKTYPPLKLSTSYPQHDSHISVEFDCDKTDGTKYIAWLYGLEVEYSEIGKDLHAVVPEDLEGFVFAVIVCSKEYPNDQNTLSGYVVTEFPFNSEQMENV